MKRILLIAFFAFNLITCSYCTQTCDENEKDATAENSKNIYSAEQQNIGLKLTDKGILITHIPEYKTRGSGIVYTRWGITTCRNGAELVYAGYAGGSWYKDHGGGANLLCMPTTGVGHLSTQDPGGYLLLYGTEYQSQNKIWFNNDYNVPCAVCYVPDKSTKLQLPGRINCPDSWTQEYRGYLMAEYKQHAKNLVFECIDEAGEMIHGSEANTDGALLYFVQPKCDRGIPCGPYDSTVAITCSICTR